MSYPKSFKEETDGQRFNAILYEIENAVIAFFNEKGRIRLGTLAVAMPQFDGTALSSVILGDRNMVITKVLAERLATNFNRIALASTNFREFREEEDGSELFKLIEKLLKKIQ